MNITEDSKLKKKWKTVSPKIRELMVKQHYYDIKIYLNCSKICIIEVKNPNYYLVKFIGLKSYSEHKIRKLLSLQGTAPVKSIIQSYKKSIKKFYLKNNFFNVTLSHRVATSNYGSRYIYIYISEGSPVFIDSINIQGVLSRPPSYYRQIISKQLFENNPKKILIERDIKNISQELINTLQAQGYLYAEMVSYYKKYIKKTKVQVSIIINEGPLVTVKSINITPDDEPILKKDWKTKAGGPFIFQNLIDDIDFIEKYFKKKGYLDAVIINKKKLVEYINKRELSISYKIKKNYKSRIKNISITGNQNTSTKTILKAIDLKRGDEVNSDILEQIGFDLKSLQVFSSISIETIDQKKGSKNLKITVNEKKPVSLKLRASGQNEVGNILSVKGSVQFRHNSLYKKAKSLEITASSSNKLSTPIVEYNIFTRYTEPFFINNTKGNISLERKESVVDFEPSSETGLERQTTSLKFSLSQSLTENLFIVFDSFNLEHLVEKNIGKEEQYSSSQTVTTSGIDLNWDYRDHPLLARRGTLYELKGLYAYPLIKQDESIHFFKGEFKAEYYKPLNKMTWANSLSLGFAYNISDKPLSGIPSRFIFLLGGPLSLRGYAGGVDRFPSPEELPLDTDNQLVVKDYTSYFLAKTEIQFPILHPIYGLIFYDIGSVAIKNKKFTRPIRTSYGTGVRFHTPIGPLALVYARKQNALLNESQYAIHLSIGSL